MTKTASTFLLALFAILNIYAQKSYVFIGSYNGDKTKEGIYVYELDTIKGNLTKITTVKDILNPSYLTLSPNGKFLFACTETKTAHAGSVSSFEFNAQNKTLTFINNQKSGGENPVYLSVHKSGKWLINGNYTEGSVSVYPLTEEGKISPMSQTFQYLEGSINPERQDRSHIHSTVFSPSQDYVFLPDLGADKIRCYRFDSLQKQPLQETEYPFTKTTLGSGPRPFTFHPNGNFAYCIEELTGTISVYKYENGKLDSIQRIDAHTKKHQEDFNSADIHISPDGRFLYASNRGNENNIAIYSIANNGTLASIGYQSTLGKTPRNFAIDPTGRFLIVANQTGGNVVVFRRNLQSGLLKKVGHNIKVKNASCVQIRLYEQ
jgi:6-phosphogluconolactonase